jgi:NTP pyrophosphatase (non-canonical NTP hydrolase)
MTYEELQNLVKKWAWNKGLLTQSKSEKQLLKTVSEIGELSDAILKKNSAEIVDAIGDVYVTIIILTEMLQTEGIIKIDEVKCLESAYNVIKNRTGQMINGTFVKDESIKSEQQKVGW